MDVKKEIQEFRKRFPVTDEWAYLETAGTGLIPDFVYEGVNRYQNDRHYKGGDSVWSCDGEEVGTLGMMEYSKRQIAALLNATPDEIAFGQSATQIFTLVTEGIDYPAKANVVAIDGGWIGNRFAWQKKENQGLEVRYAVPENGIVSAESIIALCDENTAAVTVNLVESVNGYRTDVDKIGEYCRANGILLFVDAVQALGALEVDVQKSKIDFLVGTNYKWMMGYCGGGFAYINKKLFERVTHWGAGWMSDSHRFDTSRKRLELRDDAGRFEIGYPDVQAIYALGLVAENNVKIGTKDIENYVMELANYCRAEIAKLDHVRLTFDIPDENLTQIISLTFDKDAEVTNESLKDAKVFAHVSEPDEAGERVMRISFHYYNNKNDVDRFIAAIR